jgi:AcrR family transcriptional regulator
LETQGRADFSTTEIAQTAGVSIGSLYQYFGSNDAVMAELVLREHERLLARTDEAAEVTKDMGIEDAVRVLIHALARGKPSRRISRILEEEEERLPRTPDLIAVEAAIRTNSDALFYRLLNGHMPDDRIAIVTLDAFKIARGMFDGPQPDVDPNGPDALPERIVQVILGYFDRMMG